MPKTHPHAKEYARSDGLKLSEPALSLEYLLCEAVPGIKAHIRYTLDSVTVSLKVDDTDLRARVDSVVAAAAKAAG